MSAASQPLDPARLVQALDRLSEHCDLAGRRTTLIRERRVAVRARLEQELGPELTVTLLGGLTTPSTPAP